MRPCFHHHMAAVVGVVTVDERVRRYCIHVGLMTVGITQGNPLSALWFISCFNPLLFYLSYDLSADGLLRSFADAIMT